MKPVTPDTPDAARPASRLATRLRRSGPGVATGAALVSLVVHASVAWGVVGHDDAPSLPARAVTSAGEFIELPPVPPAPELAPPAAESDAPAAANMPELPETPTGLRVRRPEAMARLSLSSYGEGSGPFGLRDRLTIGQYTPRMASSAAPRSPETHPASVDETLAAHDPAVDPQLTPTVVDETNPAAHAADPDSADPAVVVDEGTPTVVPPTADVAAGPETDTIVAIEVPETADTPRIRPASVIEESVSLELATLPGSPETDPLLETLASAALRAELGLDDVSLLRVTRSRPRASRSIALAFVTTLEASELRVRVEAALRARGATSEFSERDGTWSMTTVVDGEPHTIVIDGNVIVLAELGAGTAAVTGRIFVDARGRLGEGEGSGAASEAATGGAGDAEPTEVPLVTARLPIHDHEIMLSVRGLEVRMFAPTQSAPNGRIVARITTRPPPARAVVEGEPAAGAGNTGTTGTTSATGAGTNPAAAPMSLAEVVRRELRLEVGSLEVVGVPRVLGAIVEVELRLVGMELAELAERVVRRR